MPVRRRSGSGSSLFGDDAPSGPVTHDALTTESLRDSPTTVQVINGAIDPAKNFNQFRIRNQPLQFADELRHYARLHPSWMWATLVWEAACVIEELVQASKR
jgi:hypothetical protein